MNKQRRKKEVAVDEIREKLQQSTLSVLTDYRGLNVVEVTDLRSQLREAGIEFKVVKNTLTWLAAKEIGLDTLRPYLEGPTAIAYSRTDPVAPARILSGFAKNHKALDIKAGVLEGQVISQELVKELADLPSRDHLLAKLLGTLQAPLAGLVNVLNGPIRNFVYVLDAVRLQKEA